MSSLSVIVSSSLACRVCEGENRTVQVAYTMKSDSTELPGKGDVVSVLKFKFTSYHYHKVIGHLPWDGPPIEQPMYRV